MKRIISPSIVSCALIHSLVVAQPVSNFFPHSVGDRWDYWHSALGNFSNVITRDSVGVDSSEYLFYDNSDVPQERVDTFQQVFAFPTYPGGYLMYKLAADSGSIWQGGPYNWTWLARVDTEMIFSTSTIVKVFRYGVQHPDSGGWDRFYQEDHLANGYGLVYRYSEPSWAQYLLGCIIAGDTIGTIFVDVAEEKPDIAKEFSLEQNYPNPFNPTTTIEFNVNVTTNLGLRIFDILGREISLVFEGTVSPGVHRMVWDASGCPSGSYFLVLSSRLHIQYRKIIVMR